MIYLVRHGETVWNTLGRYQGIKDSPLTSHGVRQANILDNGCVRAVCG